MFDMDISKLTDSELADFSSNLVTLLAGTELSAIESHVRAELIAAYGTKPADFEAEVETAAVKDDEKRAAFSTKDVTRGELIFLGQRALYALKLGVAPKSQFELARFDYPATPVGVYVAQAPTELSAVGFSNGVNTGSFSGNNSNRSVVYDIWRREGDTGIWHPHTFTKKQTFRDEGITPGQYYEYRVRAVAARTISDFSNSAVVYGVL